MSFYLPQFRSLIQRILAWCDQDLVSDSAVNLLLGTAAQESNFGTYLRQLKGPAIGIFQMEPATFESLRERYKGKYSWLADCTADEMEHDLCLAIVMCRLFYWDIKQPLPKANDVTGMARYWKRFYNTEKGKGTTEEFIRNYNHFIGGK